MESVEPTVVGPRCYSEPPPPIQSEIRDLFPSRHDSEDRIQTLIPIEELTAIDLLPERDDERLSALVDLYEDRAKAATVRPAPPPPPARAGVVAPPAMVVVVQPVSVEPDVAQPSVVSIAPLSGAPLAPEVAPPRTDVDQHRVGPKSKSRPKLSLAVAVRWLENAGLPERVAFVASCAALASLVTTLVAR